MFYFYFVLAVRFVIAFFATLLVNPNKSFLKYLGLNVVLVLIAAVFGQGLIAVLSSNDIMEPPFELGFVIFIVGAALGEVARRAKDTQNSKPSEVKTIEEVEAEKETIET